MIMRHESHDQQLALLSFIDAPAPPGPVDCCGPDCAATCLQKGCLQCVAALTSFAGILREADDPNADLDHGSDGLPVETVVRVPHIGFTLHRPHHMIVEPNL
jgi:hypothetical protein